MSSEPEPTISLETLLLISTVLAGSDPSNSIVPKRLVMSPLDVRKLEVVPGEASPVVNLSSIPFRTSRYLPEGICMIEDIHGRTFILYLAGEHRGKAFWISPDKLEDYRQDAQSLRSSERGLGSEARSWHDETQWKAEYLGTFHISESDPRAERSAGRPVRRADGSPPRSSPTPGPIGDGKGDEQHD